MRRRSRRTHSAAFKAKVALAAIKGDKTLADLAQQYDFHTNQITTWRAQLLEGAASVFGVRNCCTRTASTVSAMHAKIGQLTLEKDFGAVLDNEPIFLLTHCFSCVNWRFGSGVLKRHSHSFKYSPKYSFGTPLNLRMWRLAWFQKFSIPLIPQNRVIQDSPKSLR